MNDIGAYIEQQRQAGQVESAGSFTLAIEKARDKLSTYSLANPEDYILKVVQCVCSLGVERLNIEITRSTVLVYFEVPRTDDSLSVDNLTRALLNPLEERHSARSHLSMALCALAGSQPIELMWGDWDGASTDIILSLGHGRSELFRAVPFPRTEPLAPDRRLHLLYLTKNTEGQSVVHSLTSPEKRTLAERCSFSSAAIYLNGRLLTPYLPLASHLTDTVRKHTSLYFGSLRFETNEDMLLRWHCEPKAEATISFRKELPPELTLLEPDLPPVNRLQCPFAELPLQETCCFSAVYGIPVYLYGVSKLFYVKDGVLTEPLELHDAGGGAFAILEGSEIKTDITGLKVVISQAVELDRERVIPIWKEMINDFVDNNPPVYRATKLSTPEDAVHFLFGCCMLGPLRPIVEPFLEHTTQKTRKAALNAKQFRRQLADRRGFIAYFRDARDK